MKLFFQKNMKMTDDILIGCRLCLSTEPQRSYFSLESSAEFLPAKIALSLESDFKQLDILPNHICEDCKDLLGKFQVFKTEALANEVFITRCQASIKDIGLADARKVYELKNNFHGYPEEKVIQNAEDTLDSNEKETFLFRSHDENFKSVNNIGNDLELTTDQSQDDMYGQIQETQEYSVNMPRPIDEGGFCIICQKTVMSSTEHDLKHHDNLENIECPSCGKQFLKTGPLKYQHPKLQLKQHIKMSHRVQPGKLYLCKLCQKQVGNLWRHMKDKHGALRLPCPYTTCKQIFKTKSVLKRHINIKHLGSSKMCLSCGKNIGYSSMSAHLKLCSPSENDLVDRTCLICRKVFSYRYYMKSHMNTKHGEGTPAIPCHICGKMMITQLGYDRHMHMQHTEEGKNTSIKCIFEGCDKRFRVIQTMKIHHKKVHLNIIDKQECNLCGDWLMNLDDHMRGKHKTGQKHPCTVCDKVFFSSYDLRLHKERVHEGIRYICPECGQKVSKIKDHLKSRHGITEVDVAKIEVIKTMKIVE